LKNFVQNVWILSETSGLCLLHRNFTEEKMLDETLFAGLMTAIVHLSKEFVTKDDKVSIEKLQMKSLELHYYPLSEIHCAVVMSVESKSPEKEVAKVLTQIAGEFQKKYETFFRDHTLFDSSAFKPFEEVLDTILLVEGLDSQDFSDEINEFQMILKVIKDEKIVNADETIESLLNLFEKFPVGAKKLFVNSFDVIEKLIVKSKGLSKEKRKLYKEVLNGIRMALFFYL
jgi:hypothetical protein